jgi:hypothetical protein
MNLELALRTFFKDSEPPSLTIGPDVSLYRGISLPLESKLRIKNDEPAWFCDNIDDAISFANSHHSASARPHLIHACSGSVLQLLRVNLAELSNLPFKRDDDLKNGNATRAHWQKQKLLPKLIEIWRADGIFDTLTREFWLAAKTYDVVEAVAI